MVTCSFRSSNSQNTPIQRWEQLWEQLWEAKLTHIQHLVLADVDVTAEPETFVALNSPTFCQCVFRTGWLWRMCLFTDSPPLTLPQVTFRPDLSTAEVHDESIRGPLKVGLEGWRGGEERGCTAGWLRCVVCSMLRCRISTVFLSFRWALL